MSRARRLWWLSALLVVGCTACGEPRSAASRPLATASSAPSAPPASAAAETTANSAPATAVDETTTARATPDTAGSVPVAVSVSVDDRADGYLDATTEIYRRTLPDGQDFVLRLSTASYATTFGLSWNAPTGSAEECLGDHALFLGVPGDIGSWGSAWIATPWSDVADLAQPVALAASMQAAENDVPATQFLVVRTAPDAAAVVLLSSGGGELDRAAVVDGVAMLMITPRAQDEGQTVSVLRVATVSADGLQSAPSPLLAPPSAASGPTACGPGDPPRRPLPAAGVQPTNAVAAAAQIRQRHALLVDQSIPADQKPADLLEDNTGVQAAIASLEESPYRDVAASAKYVIDELVFTAPDAAWFRYSITTSSSTFSDRLGNAVLKGGVWQITRATICQDLALALAPCQPNPPSVEPPPNAAWDAAWREWTSKAMLYTGNDGCSPLSQC